MSTEKIVKLIMRIRTLWYKRIVYYKPHKAWVAGQSVCYYHANFHFSRQGNK